MVKFIACEYSGKVTFAALMSYFPCNGLRNQVEKIPLPFSYAADAAYSLCMGLRNRVEKFHLPFSYVVHSSALLTTFFECPSA